MARVLSSRRLVDDRGREFPTVSIPGTRIWDGRDQRADMPTPLANACAAAVTEFQGANVPRVFSGWVLVIGAAWLAGLMYFASGGLLDWAFGLLFLTIVGVSWEVMRRSKRRRPYDERILATLLAAQCCPSCGYGLNGVVSNGDGTTSCSECGAAWLLPDATKLPLRRPGATDPIVSETDHPLADRISYTDGRGRAVWLLDPSLRVMPTAWAELPADRRERVEALLRMRASRERGGSILGAVILLFLGAAQLNALTRGFQASKLVLGIVLVTIGIFVCARAVIRRTLRRPETIAQTFLDGWVCPSCAATFPNPKEEADGCVTCPVCRAAWRVRGSFADSPGTA